MNTLHLKYALEVERAGSITKAADRLYMNQPHLSKTIRELEDTLGAEIFKRTSKGITPTKKGAEFLKCAKNILAQVDRMETLFDDSRTPGVSLSVTVPRASYISYAFTEFIKSVPHDVRIDIDYKESNSVRAIENVVDGRSDLGIIRFQSDYTNYYMDILEEKNLKRQLTREFEYLVLCSENHPLAGEKIIHCADLGAYIEITHGDSSIPSPRKPQNFATGEARRGEIAIYERGSQLEILNRVQTTYMWVSPMPNEVLSTFSLVQKKSDLPRNSHKDFLIYRNGYRFSEEDKAFIEKLNEIIKRTEEGA